MRIHPRQTLHRIFFSQQQYIKIHRAQRLRQIIIKRRVVGQCQGFPNNPLTCQHLKKHLRTGNPCATQHLLPRKRNQWLTRSALNQTIGIAQNTVHSILRGFQIIRQPRKRTRILRHTMTTKMLHNGKHRVQTMRRLAQRPRRQTPTIAHAALVHHHQLNITVQTIMLQTIIAHDDIAFGMRHADCTRDRHAVLPDPHRYTRVQSQLQRFIADLARQTILGHTGRFHAMIRCVRTAITTRNHHRVKTHFAQILHQSRHNRCFTHTTDHNPADHHHGNWHTVLRAPMAHKCRAAHTHDFFKQP